MLYAVVIGQSFVFLIDERYYATWFSIGTIESLKSSVFNFSLNFNPVVILGIVTLLLTYVLVIMSWFICNISSRAKDYSRGQFVIDIILLCFYYVAFASAGNLIVITHMAILFLWVYHAWDFVKYFKVLTGNKRAEMRRQWNPKTYSIIGIHIATSLIVLFYPVTYWQQALCLMVLFACLIGYSWISRPNFD